MLKNKIISICTCGLILLGVATTASADYYNSYYSRGTSRGTVVNTGGITVSGNNQHVNTGGHTSYGEDIYTGGITIVGDNINSNYNDDYQNDYTHNWNSWSRPDYSSNNHNNNYNNYNNNHNSNWNPYDNNDYGFDFNAPSNNNVINEGGNVINEGNNVINGGNSVISTGNNTVTNGNSINTGGNTINGETFDDSKGDYHAIAVIKNVEVNTDNKVLSFSLFNKTIKLIVSEDVASSDVYDNLVAGAKVKVNGYERSSNSSEVIVDVTTIELLK